MHFIIIQYAYSYLLSFSVVTKFFIDYIKVCFKMLIIAVKIIIYLIKRGENFNRMYRLFSKGEMLICFRYRYFIFIL